MAKQSTPTLPSMPQLTNDGRNNNNTNTNVEAAASHDPNRRTATATATTMHSTHVVRGSSYNNLQPYISPISVRAVDIDSDPEEALERGETRSPPAPRDIAAMATAMATTSDRYTVPFAIAVLVPIAAPRGVGFEGQPAKSPSTHGPSSATKTTNRTPNTRILQTITTSPPLPLPPPSSSSSSSSPTWFLEPSPSVQWTLAVLCGLTTLLACVVMGTLVAKGISHHATTTTNATRNE